MHSGHCIEINLNSSLHYATPEVFLTRAHAQGLETEFLSSAEVQAISRQIRASGRAISNQSVLSEVRDREVEIGNLQRQKRKKTTVPQPISEPPKPTRMTESNVQQNQPELAGSHPPVAAYNEASVERDVQTIKPKRPVPYVRVYESYNEIEREWRLQ